MNKVTDYHDALEWCAMSDLEVGEFYTLSVESPLTYLLVGRAIGRGGRDEFDSSTLVGPGGRVSTRTYWQPRQDVLVVPPEAVGDRLSAAAVAFAEREHLGIDRIVLSSDCYPWTLAGSDADAGHDDADDASEVCS